MLARVHSAALMGVDAVLVDVEVDASLGLPGCEIVGLPDSAVRESKARVYAAIRNCHLELPPRRLTINLAPADIRKEQRGRSQDKKRGPQGKAGPRHKVFH